MQILTYSLRDGEAASDEFYRRAAELTDAFLRYGKEGLLPQARKLRQLAERSGAEAPRSAEEYAFDLLTAGVLWRVYRSAAEGVSPARAKLLRRLAGMRAASPRLKPAADRLRAAWGARWLLAHGEERTAATGEGLKAGSDWREAREGELAPREAADGPASEAAGFAGVGLTGVERGSTAPARPPQRPVAPTPAQWEKLLLWLEATGEFSQEAARLRLMADCLAKAPPGAFRAAAEAAVAAAAWLNDAGARMLGGYTRRVEDFRSRLGERSVRREDAVLRNRSRVEYHLNLLGAELMNRVYRSVFSAAAKHAVLLPVCLRAHTGKACAAMARGREHDCLRCDKNCRVASVTEMGAADGFEVILISHESDAFSHALIQRLLQENAAVVGVACALNLVSGGLRAKAAGLAAQCVILDYCGCAGHWDDAGGFPTDLNLNRLQTILQPD